MTPNSEKSGPIKFKDPTSVTYEMHQSQIKDSLKYVLSRNHALCNCASAKKMKL